MSNHKSVIRNQGYTRAATGHIERHNERKNETYSNIDVVPSESHKNIHFKMCDGTYLGTFDKMVKSGEISTRGLKLNNEGTKPESSIVAEMVLDVNTEYFETMYESHGFTSGYDFARDFYAEAYKMAVREVGDEKYVLHAVMHADERNKGLSDKMGYDVFHYHLHVAYIPVVKKEIKWTKKCKDKSLIGKVKEVINQVNHSKKWESEKELGEDGKEYLVYSYSKLQCRYHDHMKAAGYHGFERGKQGSTAEHLSVIDFKVMKRNEELQEKDKALAAKDDLLNNTIDKLKLTNNEIEEAQSEIEVTRNFKADLLVEKESLQSERDKLESEVAPIRDLKRLKIKTSEIKIPDKPTFGTNVKIPYDDLVKLKKMADTYIANEDEIKNIRKRRTDVSAREKSATEKEANISGREIAMSGNENLLKNAAQVKTERDNLLAKTKNQSAKISELENANRYWYGKLQEAFSVITKIVKAARLLKYPSEDFPGYENQTLTPLQGTLLDCLALYGARLAEKNNFNDHATQMKKYIGLDDEIKQEIKNRAPELFSEEMRKQKSRSYDYGRD